MANPLINSGDAVLVVYDRIYMGNHFNQNMCRNT